MAQNAPAAAATSAAQTSSSAQDTAKGIPWWAWLIIALVILGIIFGLMRRKKEPAIKTSSTGRGDDPNIRTR
ncbi:MAG: LPXTG cell wall anchor domain-containing protein [Candidatus Eremiobacteraeota bacterium]|nr:LPXTG cell wall anchor domain-containing protein [Candidatus Eremiobacteraeota bacterium]